MDYGTTFQQAPTATYFVETMTMFLLSLRVFAISLATNEFARFSV
uniref:Uncharacterized protein n=1 Tax=uncultured bacterium 5G4 TaxID=1701326 RepID=A0A166H2U1_9BACT|nr:hypothetical protein 5G4_012 [uncultured bacterium 5G4]